MHSSKLKAKRTKLDTWRNIEPKEYTLKATIYNEYKQWGCMRNRNMQTHHPTLVHNFNDIPTTKNEDNNHLFSKHNKTSHSKDPKFHMFYAWIGKDNKLPVTNGYPWSLKSKSNIHNNLSQLWKILHVSPNFSGSLRTRLHDIQIIKLWYGAWAFKISECKVRDYVNATIYHYGW